MKQDLTNLSRSRPDSFSPFILKRVDIAFRIERKDQWFNRHTDLFAVLQLAGTTAVTLLRRGYGHEFTA